MPGWLFPEQTVSHHFPHPKEKQKHKEIKKQTKNRGRELQSLREELQKKEAQEEERLRVDAQKVEMVGSFCMFFFLNKISLDISLLRKGGSSVSGFLFSVVDFSSFDVRRPLWPKKPWSTTPEAICIEAFWAPKMVEVLALQLVRMRWESNEERGVFNFSDRFV